MGAGAVSGHSTSHSNQVYPTPSPSTYTTEVTQQRSPQNQPSVSESRDPVAMMSNNKVQIMCETCDNVFTFFKRRKVCRDCRRVFCSSCLPKPPSSLGQNGRQCTKCTILLSGKFTRAQLQAWKVKDMRCFLDVRNISTTKCKEKHDLIELLLVNFCLESNSALNLQQQEHDRLVGELADRMRQSSFYMSPSHSHQIPDDDDDDTSPTSTPQVSRSPLRIRSSADQTDTSTVNRPSSSQAGPRSSQSGPNVRSSNQSEPTQPRASQSGPVQLSSSQLRNSESGPTLTNNSLSRPAVTISTQGEAEVGEGQEEDEDFEEGMSNLRSILSGHLLERQQRELREALHRLQEELAQDQPETRPGIQRATIEDIQSEDDVDGLTVRQMKEILVNNFVDYRGCVEKCELVDRVKRLWAETQANKHRVAAALGVPATEDTAGVQCGSDSTTATTTAVEAASGPPPDGEKDVCKICMDAPIDCILLECGHMITCTKCGKRLADCPICRQYITRVVHVFRS